MFLKDAAANYEVKLKHLQVTKNSGKVKAWFGINMLHSKEALKLRCLI